jgi:pantoate ligase/cytidylate kinase
MGALHEGHLSLIRRARRENKIVVVSIFVNPLQFGPHEDFQRYPRVLQQDMALCEEAGADIVFAPTIGEMGVEETIQTEVVPPEPLSSVLCGKTRIGHFRGVATIVTKLLNLVQPNRAYFGQKDAQQLVIIKRMVADLNIPVEIIGCSIVREPGGLAMSSRNQYLSAEEREQARALYRGLQRAEQMFRAGERLATTLVGAVKAELQTVPAIAPEYVELVHPETLHPLNYVESAGLLTIAARLGSTRLIDNVILCDRQPIMAIDGPAGAGKSTVARRVAAELGLLYLDTGAMYRALTWLVIQSGTAIEDEPGVAELISQCHIEFKDGGQRSGGDGGDREDWAEREGRENSPVRIFVNGQDVTREIRSLEVTSQVSAIAAQAAVRAELVKQQRRYGQRGGIVVEGRDIGTHVFPDAELKIYLTASVQERARRRLQDLKNQGKAEISLDELEQAIYERDRKDSNRALAPLRKAVDAIEVQTDNMTVNQVIEHIVELYRQRTDGQNNEQMAAVQP